MKNTKQNHQLKRSIGLVGLTFIALSGMLGSGWLFVPQLVSQLAGPAGIIAWGIGGGAMLVFALCYAEISAMLPFAGGLARIPWFSHGTAVSGIMSWAAWVGYTLTAPIEVLVILKYTGTWMPFIFSDVAAVGTNIALSPAGYAVAIALMALMVVINAVGVRFFAAFNNGLTWLKIAAPAIIVGVLVAADFNFANFTSHGFAPFGADGVFAAVSTGGVVFAFLGFRHAIDMAGEVKHPQRTIPLALAGALVLCLLVYLAAQVAFIGGIPEGGLADGWSSLTFDHHMGPFAAIALVLGFPWLMAVIYGTAVIAPFGAGLVATGSNARLSLAMARIGLFPEWSGQISVRGVPLNSLLLNLGAGIFLFLFLNFETLVALISTSIILSFIIGPITLYALRLQIPDRPRSFRLPAARLVCCLTFILSSFLLYWSGWNTLKLLGLALVAGFIVFFAVYRLSESHLRPVVNFRQALWLVPYLVIIGLVSYFGGFSGGQNTLPEIWAVGIIVVTSAAIFFLAVKLRLPADQAAANVRETEASAAPDSKSKN